MTTIRFVRLIEQIYVRPKLRKQRIDKQGYLRGYKQSVYYGTGKPLYFASWIIKDKEYNIELRASTRTEAKQLVENYIKEHFPKIEEIKWKGGRTYQ